MIQTLADTIIWMARERVAAGQAQDVNAAIVAITNEVDLKLMPEMDRDASAVFALHRIKKPVSHILWSVKC